MSSKKDCSTSRVINNGDGTFSAYTKDGDLIGTWALAGLAGPPGPAGAAGATGPAGPTAVSTDASNIAALGTDGLIFVEESGKQAYHPTVPIAAVVENPGRLQLASNANTFEVEDTNDFIIEFGVDGKLRIKKRTIAARMSMSGNLMVVAGAEPIVPFDTLAFNIGGQAALAPAHFTAPFDCLLHVDALTIWDRDEWTDENYGPWTGVSVNGAPALKIGYDYAAKGLAYTGGSTLEIKTPGGGVLLTLSAGDQVNIVVGNGEDPLSGMNHSINTALASFYVVSAL